jgi:hypothetical protein
MCLSILLTVGCTFFDGDREGFNSPFRYSFRHRDISKRAATSAPERIPPGLWLPWHIPWGCDTPPTHHVGQIRICSKFVVYRACCPASVVNILSAVYITTGFYMSFKPEPWVVYCPECGWRRICAPKSDAITPWQNPHQCWQCHHDNLQRGPLTLKDRLRLLLRKPD